MASKNKALVEELQRAIVSVLRSDEHENGLYLWQVQSEIRLGFPHIEATNLDLRVSANLTSLVKRGEVEKIKKGRHPVYFAVFASNDTSVEELAEEIMSVVASYDCTPADVAKALAERRRWFQAVTPKRIEAAIRRLVKQGELIETRDGDGATVYGVPLTEDQSPALTPEVTKAVSLVIPKVHDRRNCVGRVVTAEVETSGFPRLFQVRPDERGNRELRWRQRNVAGLWRLARVRFHSIVLEGWYPTVEIAALNVSLSPWGEDLPSYR